jgi:hypothetical protein
MKLSDIQNEIIVKKPKIVEIEITPFTKKGELFSATFRTRVEESRRKISKAVKAIEDLYLKSDSDSADERAETETLVNEQKAIMQVAADEIEEAMKEIASFPKELRSFITWEEPSADKHYWVPDDLPELARQLPGWKEAALITILVMGICHQREEGDMEATAPFYAYIAKNNTDMYMYLNKKLQEEFPFLLIGAGMGAESLKNALCGLPQNMQADGTRSNLDTSLDASGEIGSNSKGE